MIPRQPATLKNLLNLEYTPDNQAVRVVRNVLEYYEPSNDDMAYVAQLAVDKVYELYDEYLSDEDATEDNFVAWVREGIEYRVEMLALENERNK